MSIMVGVGKGAGAGVLIRSAEALERMEKVDTLVVDKTGTLTEGKPRVVAIVPRTGLSADAALALAASLERSSEHPLAAAIVAAARERGLPLPEVSGFASVTGKGVTGTVDGRTLALGNARLMAGARHRSRRSGRAGGGAARRRRHGAVPGGGRRRPGPSSPSPTRSSARTPDALAALRADGIRIVMLTGDNRTTAEAVARTAGHRRGARPTCCPRTSSASSAACASRDAWSPWPATA